MGKFQQGVRMVVNCRVFVARIVQSRVVWKQIR